MQFEPGDTVFGFVSKTFGICTETVRKDFKTIILNHKAVDTPAGKILKDGDTLVLSGAMPGLVGAMLRSDSPLKEMRKGVSAPETADTAQNRGSNICGGGLRLKLFNTVLIKYGPLLYERNLLPSIEVKTFATLQLLVKPVKRWPIDYDSTVDSVIKMLQIPPEKASIIFVNNKHASPGQKLRSGDVLAVFPPVGGG